MSHSNTAPQSRHSADYLGGEDYFEWGLAVDWGVEWTKLKAKLENAKSAAFRRKQAQSSGADVIDFGTSRAHVQRTGEFSDRSNRFRYVLHCDGFEIRIANVRESRSGDTNVSIAAKGEKCLECGGRGVLEAGRDIIKRAGGTIRKEMLWRVDLCLDLPSVGMDEFVTAYNEKRYIPGAKYRRADESSGISLYLGKGPLCLRIYDKHAQLLSQASDYALNLVKDRRWHGMDEMQAVRVEFQLRRAALRNRGIDSPEDYFRKRGALARYLTTKWIRFTKGPVDHRNTGRAATMPRWQEVQQGFGNWAGQPCGESLAPLPRDAVNVDQLKKQGIGVNIRAAQEQGIPLHTWAAYQDYARIQPAWCTDSYIKTVSAKKFASPDKNKGYPLAIDWDGILVDDEEHPDDITRRIRDALAVIWKDRAEAIEQEACGILGVKELRDYFRKPGNGGFWMDHVKRYSKSRRKAPIYWLFQSAGKNYALWIYYHRLDKDLLFKALVKYVEPKLKLERDRVEQCRNELLAAGSSGRSAKALERRLADQEDLLSDLQDFHDKLRRAADLRLDPDLNDGVVLNIAPLWELVPWKEAKSYWDELMAGEYGWSSIGKQLRTRGIPPIIARSTWLLASRSMAALATSVVTITLPSGAKETCANLKWASPKGMPMIVMQYRSPAMAWLRASHRPARTHHRKLTKPVPKILSLPSRRPSISCRPNGKAAKTEMRKAALANGIPIMVMAKNIPERNHNSQAKRPPPRKNQRILPTKDMQSN